MIIEEKGGLADPVSNRYVMERVGFLANILPESRKNFGNRLKGNECEVWLDSKGIFAPGTNIGSDVKYDIAGLEEVTEKKRFAIYPFIIVIIDA